MKASWIACCFLLLPILLSQAQGSSRKLTTMAVSTSPASNAKNEKINNGGNSPDSLFDAKGTRGGGTKAKREEKEESFWVKSEEQKEAYDLYPDVLDIAGMDYSPAKRKTPIHN